MRKKILVVEDDGSTLNLETILLASKGYDIRTALDGQAALDCLAKEKPDLVVLDILLPLVDGFEVCQHIKGNPATKDIPVVLVTVKSSKEDRALGQWVGADYFIAKPFRAAELLDITDSLLCRTE